jgi:ribosomal protein S18 acetylase RimI-like enzyme
MSGAAISKTVIRAALEDDIAALAQALAPDVSARQLAQRWEEHLGGYRKMLVAEETGSLAGTVSIGGARHRRTDSLRMFALDVGVAFQRRGIGASLIRAVEGEAHRRGLLSVHLEVALANTAAIRLYERLGYRRQAEPITDRWSRVADDGSRDEVEEASWVMVKKLQTHED